MLRLPFRCVFQSLETRRQFLSKPFLVRNLTFYEVLGIDSNATQAEVREAYVRCSKKIHPDINKSDPEADRKFVEVNEAYSILSKGDSRTLYDLSLNPARRHTNSLKTHRKWNNPPVNVSDYTDEYYYGASSPKSNIFKRKGFFIFISPLVACVCLMLSLIQFLEYQRTGIHKNLMAKMKENHRKEYEKIMIEREKRKEIKRSKVAVSNDMTHVPKEDT